ncbi:MAG: hypothetical protein ACI8T1_000686 [Verrucomicrobiales bacterium]|jgi:hypothetical protein
MLAVRFNARLDSRTGGVAERLLNPFNANDHEYPRIDRALKCLASKLCRLATFNPSLIARRTLVGLSHH